VKCVICNCTFEPTDEERRMRNVPGRAADIPFCSLDCAKADAFTAKCYAKRGIPRDLYHVGAKDPAPTFGVFVERTVDASRHGDGGKAKMIKIRVNVGGGVVVRPITAHERAWAAHLRGRTAFSEGCTVCVLPNASKYATERRARGPFDYPHDAGN